VRAARREVHAATDVHYSDSGSLARNDEWEWLREKEVLQRYKRVFTKGWLRETRQLMRSGRDPNAGPNFSTCGSGRRPLVWYQVAEIERFLREHDIRKNGAK